MTPGFYDQLAPYYHLLFPDWEASSERQSRGLAHVLGEFGVEPGSAVLDAACGIGTQTLGLAHLGYKMTASDLSPAAAMRARAEAHARRLGITFAVADLRRLSYAVARFAAVLACDNAIPHLLSDEDIRTAFAECRRVLQPGGIVVLSVRDYAALERRTPDHHSYGTRTAGATAYTAEQIWRWDGDQYDLTLRLTEQCAAEKPVVHEFQSRYYAVSLATLERLLREAGFDTTARRDEYFFQPLLIAINPPAR